MKKLDLIQQNLNILKNVMAGFDESVADALCYSTAPYDDKPCIIASYPNDALLDEIKRHFGQQGWIAKHQSNGSVNWELKREEDPFTICLLSVKTSAIPDPRPVAPSEWPLLLNA